MTSHPTHVAAGRPRAGRFVRWLPFLGWPRVTPASLRGDLIAGVTVSLVAIPQSLAYAQLAGVPPQYGLYAAFIPAIVGALFGSSLILSTGPVALTSLLTAASVGVLVPPGTEQFYAYVTMLALVSGLIQLGFGLARAGVLLSLVSHPVLMGFINAAALIIALSQLPALMGIPVRQSKHLLLDTWNVVSRPDLLHEISLAFGVAAIGLMVAFRRFAPRFPGVLVTVVLATWVSHALGFAERGGRVVGEVPAGLPLLALPDLDWTALRALLPAGFVVALLSFMEAMSSCKVIAIRKRTRWDENQELIGQGLAKIAAAFCQSMPVSGSFSRSALNLSSHATTGLSSIFAAAAVLLTLLFFTPYLADLPKPVLAAMIMLAVLNLVDVRALTRAWRASKDDGIAAAATFVITLAFAPNIQNGILAGIIISLVAFYYRRMRPRVAIVGLHEDGLLRDAARFDLPPLHERIGAIRFDASLYFANASFFEDAVLRLERDRPEVAYILVSGHSINDIDASGVETLRNLSVRLRQSGVTLVLSGLKRQVEDVLERTGALEALGRRNIYSSDQAAIADLRTRLAAEPAPN
ncbi:MAG TPA: SulP family inorganic anion transporter [Casimicrobiaceae bacterium]|nr:SulP family inorganic anion transporter [Casimicrobiaceae bacterium]